MQNYKWRRVNKNRSIPEELIQDLGCVKLEQAPAADCCDFESECKVLRTENKVPKPINLHHRDAFERVGPIDVTKKPFSFKSHKNAVFFGNGRFNRDIILAYYLNERIYLASKSALPNFIE